MKRFRPTGQMSDAYLTALLLTLSGGFQDAYSYCFRGQVFANAQTGNIVLLSVHLLRGSWGNALHYLIPLGAFVAGTCFAELIRGAFRYARRLHWRQTVLLLEILTLFFVAFIPVDNIANALISFVCAMQVQSFRRCAATPTRARCASATCAAARSCSAPFSARTRRTCCATPCGTAASC